MGCLRKHKSPQAPKEEPELDDSPFLDNEDHRLYQMCVGMEQWLVTIGWLDIAFALTSYNRFSTAPREGHMQGVLHIWGYLKKYPMRCISIDPWDLIIDDQYLQLDEIDVNFSQEYPDAMEELDPKFPKPYGKPLTTTVFIDSSHANDKKTGCSITMHCICRMHSCFLDQQTTVHCRDINI